MELRPLIPNIVSLSRVPLGVAFLLVYDTSDATRFVCAIGIAVLAFLTDVIDGQLARRLGVASDAGALVDGIGDKAFYVAVYLVMAAEQVAPSWLLWGLIVREVALYALRTIDGNRVRNTRQLRWASLTYAFVIRMYFLYFFILGVCELRKMSVPPLLSYGAILGYVALVFGFIGLAKLTTEMVKEA